ncbi:uncharacterized protein BT62DRAFT_923445 [Guyanagaster necrorhizus]|uniref:Uncharacterized protein n=1 Tax=Guyanagaster necrorhizus TaxID=856835 RepID=A0A9P7VIL6_9AGAR|nr:uncharacterized protein BT62DRAFT_923445 [Guyanagaster necrorhizus MCA 3950]KAG7441220.1 hypothetical protein BT62DRAFT_923445 [Guyanagaster necrorhizus MCA 3950]
MASSNSTDIPQLSDNDIKLVYDVNNEYLNQLVVLALMHGILFLGDVLRSLSDLRNRTIYLRIIGDLMEYIYLGTSKVLACAATRKFMLLMVMVLYVLATVYMGVLWSFTRYAFIDDGQTFWSIFVGLQSVTDRAVTFRLVGGITKCTSTVIADSSMIWRCWIVWGRRCWIILLPILCTISGTVFDAISVYHLVADTTEDESDSGSSAYAIRIDWTMLSLSFTLATTVLCTILIIYRIVTVADGKHGSGLPSYRGVVEVIVESAALYSASTIVYMAFVARNELTGAYANEVNTAIKGIAPTLIVGRVASGHARPDDTWKESVLSSLHFGAWSRAARNREATHTVTFENSVMDLENVNSSERPQTGAENELPIKELS